MGRTGFGGPSAANIASVPSAVETDISQNNAASMPFLGNTDLSGGLHPVGGTPPIPGVTSPASKLAKQAWKEPRLPRSVLVPPISVQEIPSVKGINLPAPEILVATDPALLASLVKEIQQKPESSKPPETAEASKPGELPANEERPLTASITEAPEALKEEKEYSLTLEKTQPLEEAAGSNYHGSFSRDSKVLIFSSNRSADETTELFQCYVRDLKGTSGSMRAFPWKGNVWTPEFTPDGKAVVFSSDSEAREHIFVQDRATQQVHKLTGGDGKNMMPAISPDGKFVVFSSDSKGNNDIWLIGIDGKNPIQVTSGPEDDREPRWTPDGNAVIFTRIKEKLKASSIMKVNLNPIGEPEPLVDAGSRNWMPDLSPDAKFLAYVRSANTDGSGNVIRLRNLKTGDDIPIAPFKGADSYRPIWTPDGKGLVFHADRRKKKSLYLAELKRVPVS